MVDFCVDFSNNLDASVGGGLNVALIPVSGWDPSRRGNLSPPLGVITALGKDPTPTPEWAPH